MHDEIQFWKNKELIILKTIDTVTRKLENDGYRGLEENKDLAAKLLQEDAKLVIVLEVIERLARFKWLGDN